MTTMKQVIRIAIAIAMIAEGIFCAQTHVAPGDGTLATAIQAAAPGDTLYLTGGVEYTHSSSSSSIAIINKPLTLQVERGATQKAVIKLANSVTSSKSYYLFMIMNGGALTLRGIEINGLVNNVPVAMSMVKFDGSPDPHLSKIGTFRFENCVFHDFTDNIVHGMTDNTCRGLIQDSVFIDNVLVYNAQAFLQYKHVNLRHLEMKNSTVYRMQGLGLKIGKIGYRCVLKGSGKPYIALYDSSITPTGFIDHCTMNDMGDIHGHMEVDDAFHKLTISNCIITNQDRMIGHPLISGLVALQPTIYFLNPRPDTAADIRNVCFWKTAPPNADVGGTRWIGYAFHDTLTMDPHYRDTANGDFTLPYNSPLRTYGTDGGAIGDPRWTQGTTSVEKDRHICASDFQLSQNYPNPFNPSTSITYSVAQEEFVDITVHDVFGREITTLANGVKLPGSYSVRWNAAEFSDGIYFYTMRSKTSIATKKMLLLK
jgi:Domain of unknown function (DUF5123)/Secretion system C-terminal sorting domain